MEGIEFIIETLTDPEHGVIEDIHEIKAAGHRVVHGGESFSSSVMITEAVKKDIEECSKSDTTSFFFSSNNDL